VKLNLYAGSVFCAGLRGPPHLTVPIWR